jgi:hypothetical protein
MATQLTDEQWKQYEEEGWLKLGNVLSDDDLAALQQRIDDIMMGKADIDYDRIMMQLDSETGAYGDAGEMSKGHKGATLNYRKMQDLEYDPLFLEYMQHPLFEDICRRTYGEDTPIGCFRAMFMNKPAHKGTQLPWHQDRWNYLDRDPLVTLWTALDPATKANGCVKIVPRSHKLGLINPSHTSGFLTDEQAMEVCKEDEVVYLELEAGEVALLHNWLLHSSETNKTDISRRAFSVCYLDANTQGGGDYNIIFGEGALDPKTVAAKAGA